MMNYIGIMSERLDDYGKVIEREFFIKFIETNYECRIVLNCEFRMILGVSHIGKCDIRILNNMRECILDIITINKDDCFKIFTEFCGNSELIKIFQEKLREIKNTTYKQLYKEDFKEFVLMYLSELGYKNITILCKDYYE